MFMYFNYTFNAATFTVTSHNATYILSVSIERNTFDIPELLAVPHEMR